jgi:NADPH-dependent 2,4-dienoyl-CoA reductase/sulfur reductase-like enzyme
MKIAVIGGVAAGMSAASGARRHGKSAEITVLERGSAVSYGACGLPYYAEGRIADWRSLIVHTPETFQRERGVEVRTNAEVVELEHARRRLRLRDGGTASYDKLILCTGAALHPPPPEGVHTLHNPAGAAKLRQRLDDAAPGRAAIVGGGYIGIEAAEVLRARAWRVVIFEQRGDLLGREDSELTRRIGSHLTRCHVDVRLGQAAKSFEADRVNGEPFELVLLAGGLRPNTELAQQAGIALGRTGAIAVSDHMETSTGGIYAAGDCAETTDLVSGAPVWIPLGTTANKMGRVAGACAAGARERFPGVVGTTIARACGLGVAVTGLSPAQAKAHHFRPATVWIKAKDRASYFQGHPTEVQLTADKGTGRLLGASVMGYYGVEGRINTVAAALQARMSLEDFAQLDLAYAPPFSPVWDPLLVAAHQLRKLLH